MWFWGWVLIFQANADLDGLAKEFVQLTLDLGQHDAYLVDAYYGDPELQKLAESEKKPLDDLAQSTKKLLKRLDSLKGLKGEELKRWTFLRAQVRALRSRAEFLQGKKLSFDEEAAMVYDAKPPHYDDAHFQKALDELSLLLPGEGSLTERLSAFKAKVIVPSIKLDAVFRAAINEARSRTRRHIELPQEENFEVEYVKDQPWSAYNWYKGNFHSLIQVNVDYPISIDRIIDLACHEGYPGHHVFNALVEQDLVRQRGWVEYSVYPLFSPQSLIAEGSANYGIQVVFPAQDRLTFERDVLYPLAGLDPQLAEPYLKIQALMHTLNYAGNEAARQFLAGNWDAPTTSSYLQKYTLMDPARADQRVRFIERYRSYVINYNLGQDQVAEALNAACLKGADACWKAFENLLRMPPIPSQLAGNAKDQ